MNTLLQRFVVLDSSRPNIRCVVYAKNSLQAAEGARATLRYMLGRNPKTAYVYTTHEDGSAKEFLTRFEY